MSSSEKDLPVYDFTTLLNIAGLATQPMLRRDRRQLAEGQKPEGQYWTGQGWVRLYKTADAVDMPPLSPGRQRLYDKARTCAMCGTTSKFTFPKGRDGERYCVTCQTPAAKRLFERERAEDAQERHPLWTRNLAVDLDGTVLLDAEIRYNFGEPFDDHPQVDDLRQRSPLAAIDRIKALTGRRMIAWWPTNAPDMVTSFTVDGMPAAFATRVHGGDSFGRIYDRWVGELDQSSSYLAPTPRLKQHAPPRSAQECVTRMRELLTEMAAGFPQEAARA